jgi:hypothetical protein
LHAGYDSLLPVAFYASALNVFLKELPLTDPQEKMAAFSLALQRAK